MPRAAAHDARPQMIQMPMAAAAPADVPQMIQMQRAAAHADVRPQMIQMPRAAAPTDVQQMLQMTLGAGAPMTAASAPQTMTMGAGAPMTAAPQTKHLVLSRGKVFPVKQPPPEGPKQPSGPPPLFENEFGRYYFDVDHKKRYVELFGIDGDGNPAVVQGDEVEDVLETTEDEDDAECEDDEEEAEHGGVDHNVLKRAMADMINEKGQLTEDASKLSKAMQEEDEEKQPTGRKAKFRAGRRVQAQRLKKLMQDVYGVELKKRKEQKGGSKGKGKEKGSAGPDRSYWKKGSSPSSSSWYDWR